MSFAELNLDTSLLRAVEACGFTAPTEIQRQAIPAAIEGRDLMASAQTGTGKTAAFVLPALQRLLQPSAVHGRGPRVLVLTPTRELAQQVTGAINDFGRQMRVRAGTIVGGEPYGPQMKLLDRPVDFLIATPGRLLDHMSRGRIDFSRLELLVLDEADRMLDMGFIDDVEQIAAAAPATRQTLLFSATLEGDIQRVAQRLLREPVRIQVAGVKVKHESIEQRIHLADDFKHKNALLSHLLNDQELSQCVVFTATKKGADELAMQLEDQGHAAAALHGDMHQKQRQRTVERMKRGHVRVLVATDVAARGLDIKGISHVINFDLPMQAEDYVHRIGRTGRGGASGIAVSLVGPQERFLLGRIEKLTGQRLERHVIAGLEPTRQETRPHPAGSGFKKNGRRPNGAPRHGKPGGEKRFADKHKWDQNKKKGPQQQQRHSGTRHG
ncbi:DEAD/DEAH box helicase [Sulfurivermis fontis]|uniref:DEAD/DEAH box helicase n=1 Tax=Sulfurivermis fontis TaxID=1972068 RepID=UPI000FD7D11B|nr:DEAD/DEAH box helicase [Sulfurivermis fontis]